jgi:hypothetical protein
MIRRFLCKLIGHKDAVIISKACEGHYSTWGWFHCSRCGRDKPFQYDE